MGEAKRRRLSNNLRNEDAPATKPKGAREPRTPLATIAEAKEAAILAVMRPWPAQMEAELQAHGYEDFSAGDLMWQRKFEFELWNPRTPDTLGAVVWLAEQGHPSAQAALKNYATILLEDGKADLPSSLRAYLVLLINGKVPPRPADQSDTIHNMLRDLGVLVMVKCAAVRWSLSRLNSSASRHSAAWFVGEVMTAAGHEVGERHIRRICQTYAGGFAERIAEFLLGGALKDQTI